MQDGFENKKIGESGERIAIGELAKYNIEVATPLCDSLPFDFIIIWNDKLLKAQVKTSRFSTSDGTLKFDLTSKSSYSTVVNGRHRYEPHEVDVIILCDLKNIFLLSYDDFKDKRNFTIRYTEQYAQNCNMAHDYILSENRIREVLN